MFARRILLGSMALALLGVWTPARAAEGAKPAFDKLLADEWDARMSDEPVWASTLGDRRFNDRWPDRSQASYTRRAEALAEFAKRQSSIERGALPAADQLGYDLFAYDLATAREALAKRWYLVPMTHSEGLQTEADVGDLLRFETVKDYEDWLLRMERFPDYMKQTQGLMEAGIKAGMLLPKVIMKRVPAQLDAQIAGAPEQNSFYTPFKKFPAGIATAKRNELKLRASTLIRKGIVPAFRSFKQFYVGTYLPACYDQVGLWRVPGGDALYAFDVKRHTTTNLTPEQLHATGISEVARIRKEMERVKAATGFKGDLPAFFKFLRTDRRFYYRKPEELLAAYRVIAKTIDPKLVKLFGTLPRMPYGVEPIPAAIAPYTTTAYYNEPAADGSRAGTFYVNLFKPEARPRWEMTALALHESVPGHHLQISLAYEQTGLPAFRRYGGYTAFVEGWGLYAESLGDEMGMYTDPYAKFGQLTYEMWRAVRLVVDTGMHHFHWDRERAIQYFLLNTPRQPLDVANEIDRYIADPGQALAYKTGQLRIKALRDEARTRLGAKFDIRAFHDAVLHDGAVPLDVLEANIHAWENATK